VHAALIVSDPKVNARALLLSGKKRTCRVVIKAKRQS